MKLENNWQYKSLFNLEKTHPDNPGEAQTRLVKRCYELIKLPLNEYTIEDLRLMIGQEFDLFYLIPLAIEKLNDNLFAEGDIYEGDLLASVLRINPAFWKQNLKLKRQLTYLIENRRYDLAIHNISIENFRYSSTLISIIIIPSIVIAILKSFKFSSRSAFIT